MFAEDIELLPDRIFASILDEAIKRPDDFVPMLGDLFRAMANRNGRFGTAAIPWFNGGLFDDDDVLPLGMVAVRDLVTAARLDWKAIDPTIFGTLFESGLDDQKRAEMASLFDASDPEDHTQPQLFNAQAPDRGVGIHYTDEATIMKIIEPVVVAPLRREWERTTAEIREIEERRARARTPAEKAGCWPRRAACTAISGQTSAATGSSTRLAAQAIFSPYRFAPSRILISRVLDDAAAMGLPRDEFRIGPEAVMGIEINGYAAELARLTVWITELQWQLQKGLGLTRRPILDKLDGIVRADALITQNGKDSAWPEADVVVGNPPFLGGKRMRKSLRDDYVDRLFAAFAGRVPAEADLVAYWFAKAWERMREGRLKRAGLVATQAIRRGASRRVLDRIAQTAGIFDAWADEPWVVDGAAVRVSLICFATDAARVPIRLDGKPVERIGSDLSGSATDLTTVRPLAENEGVAFMGDTKGGAFDIPGELARKWLQLPLNPNGRSNSNVLRPWMNGMDVTRRPADKWIIDFGWEMSERDAALYEAPFTHCLANVKPERDKLRREAYRRFWWRHVEPRPGMWRSLRRLQRYAATPRVAKHRIFEWAHRGVVPDSRLFVFAREDDVFFGVLQSRLHAVWALALGSRHGDGNQGGRPTYNNETCFGTFPFPEGLTPNIPAAQYADDPRAVAITEAARRLKGLREAWLNPPDLVERVPEAVPGYPDRIVPVSPKAAAILKTRTLTNLYNERPAWLDNAHRDLDAVVAAAYGWPVDLAQDEALARLLALNLERAAAGR